jgi:excinuclease ABC subunit A
MKSIIIKGAREHNLKDITVTLPRDKFIVITGVSGSGKSTLAFDTIYAEGQRRYVESLSAYARQFLGQMSIRSKACPQPSPSSRRPPPRTPAALWER